MVDVRIKRADLPEKNEQNVFNRMRTERERQAKKFRAEGDEEARKIRSELRQGGADPDGRRAAEVGGDARRGRRAGGAIFADAYGRDPEFYAFVRTLEAYRTTLGQRHHR